MERAASRVIREGLECVSPPAVATSILRAETQHGGRDFCIPITFTIGSPAPTGRHSIARGNALGNSVWGLSPVRATRSHRSGRRKFVPPLQGLLVVPIRTQGFALGYRMSALQACQSRRSLCVIKCESYRFEAADTMRQSLVADSPA